MSVSLEFVGRVAQRIAIIDLTAHCSAGGNAIKQRLFLRKTVRQTRAAAAITRMSARPDRCPLKAARKNWGVRGHRRTS